MRPLFSFLQNNVWTSLFLTPILLTFTPGAIVSWWPGVPPSWAPAVAGAIGVSANLVVTLTIAIVLRLIAGFKSRRHEFSSTDPSNAVPNDEPSAPTQRSTLQTVNSASGFAAMLTMAGALLFMFVPQISGLFNDSTSVGVGGLPNQVALTPTVAMPSPPPTANPLPTSATTLTDDQLIAMIESSRTTEGQNRSARRSAEILVNRGNYRKATQAALASVGPSAKSETLAFVARSAVEEGRFIDALEAAGEIYPPADHNRVELEVICAVKEAASESITPDDGPKYDDNPYIPSLTQMIAATSSGGTPKGQDRELRKIAEIAIIQLRYDVAIDAASEIYYLDAEADALTFVARCAVEEGLFNHARDAAEKIGNPTAGASVQVEVLTAIKNAEKEGSSPIIDSPSTSCR